jgi:hypothetical protein
VLTVDYHGHVWSVVDGDEVYGATVTGGETLETLRSSNTLAGFH